MLFVFKEDVAKICQEMRMNHSVSLNTSWTKDWGSSEEWRMGCLQRTRVGRWGSSPPPPGPLLVKEEPSAEAAPRVTSCHCVWKNLEAIRVTRLPSIKREREREFLFDVKLLVKTPDIPTGYRWCRPHDVPN